MNYLHRKTVDTNAYCFLDESKQTHSCVVTMNESADKYNVTQEYTNVSCFLVQTLFRFITYWMPCCMYLSNKVTKAYHSEITKDGYRITDNITKKRKEMLNQFNGKT